MRRSTGAAGPIFLLTLALTALLSSCVVPPSPRSDAAALARGPRVADATVEYSNGLYADLYRARSGGNRGVIVLVHAGGFYSGKRGEVSLYVHPVMDQLDRGFAVLSVDYRLVSGASNLFPAALEDVSRAITWVRTSGSANGLNPRTIVVAGHSAGATIAALIGLGANNPGSPRGVTPSVDGWIAMSGFYDLAGDGVAALQRDVWLGSGASAAVVRSASAVTLVDAADPPGYLVAGSKDPLVPVTQSIQLALATLESGRPAWLDVVSDPSCDGHVPTCAVNTPFLNAWIDDLAR